MNAKRRNKNRATARDLQDQIYSCFRFHCTGCGKDEWLTLKQYESGDSGWYTEEPVKYPDLHVRGVCGGSQYCLP